MKKKRIVAASIAVTLMFLAGCTATTPGVNATADPVFTPEGGIYNYTKSVEIACTTPDSEIYYTLDGSTPTESSNLYTTPITISGNGTTTEIKAITVSPDLQNGSNTASYQISYSLFPSMTGTITTGGGVDINNVKVGLFFKGNVNGPNSSTNINLNDDVDDTDPSGRVYYNEADNGSDVEIAAARIGEINSSTGSYILPIPSTPPARGTDGGGNKWSEGYYALAWYDSDGDGNLDLKDGPATTYAADGEYNRMPTKAVELNGTPGTACYIDFIEQNELDAESYQFKYYNVDDSNDYDHIPFSEAENGNFDFNIDAVTDTN